MGGGESLLHIRPNAFKNFVKLLNFIIMKKLFAFLLIFFLSLVSYNNINAFNCSGSIVYCENPNSLDPRGCDTYWACECMLDYACTDGQGGMNEDREIVPYW